MKSRVGVVALLVSIAALWVSVAAPSVVVSAIPPATTTTTTTTTTTGAPDAPIDAPIASNIAPADAPAPATRGSSIQETPTLPPPPTEPPTTTVAPAPPDTGVPYLSGIGRRVVYSKNRMRVWIVDGNNVTVRTYRVSGRFGQPDPGTYQVFSRSTFTCNIDHPDICMRFMVRFAQGPKGDNIGFHEIPKRDGVPIQSDAQLGQALSGGCVRQATADAEYMWAFAGIGTTVVVTD
ncbi:MAG: L,D-transpeptidase [Actinomycetota bacterium]|nr:L,D-transpeptidase [Actinomycetota bacterium]